MIHRFYARSYKDGMQYSVLLHRTVFTKLCSILVLMAFIYHTVHHTSMVVMALSCVPAACSVRAPHMGSRQRPQEPYAVEARDFLRKKLIGREVNVKLEYKRRVPVSGVCLCV